MPSDAQSPVGATRVELMDGAACVVTWPLGGAKRDLALVDLLARLQLGAGRLGWRIQVRDVDEQLRALLEMVGLTEVLTLEPRR
ncbi:MAG: hypothetical protein ACJ735_12395 [Actinomycetes bacterium]